MREKDLLGVADSFSIFRAISNGLILSCLAMSKQSDEVNSPNCGFAGISNRIVDSATSGNAFSITFLRRVSHCFLKSAKGLDDASTTVIHIIVITVVEASSNPFADFRKQCETLLR